MQPMKILVFSKGGNQLVDTQVGSFLQDEDANFRGILSILEPISTSESFFVFSMKLGRYHIDISFAYDYYVMSVIHGNTKSQYQSLNAFYAWNAAICFSQIMSQQVSKDEITQNLIEKFEELLPVNPFPDIDRILKCFLIENLIDYVAFVVQGHRVLHSVGETKVPPDQFIYQWCAALEACESLPGNKYIQLSDYPSIIAFQFYPSIIAITFCRNSVSDGTIQQILDQIAYIKQELQSIFTEKQLKPQMPQGPKPSSSSSRRPNRS